MTSGIHHFTGITANVQANVDFYVGFLGLRLVKQTGGFADAEQLHLIYGDGLGSPGSLLTFLVWEAAGRGGTGIGQVSEVGLAVPPSSLGDWLTKALAANMPLEGPAREFGESVLRLKDPDGLIVKLVGVDMATPAPIAGSPARIRGVTFLTDKATDTASFLTRFGYRTGERAGQTQRMVSDTDIVDVREVSGFVRSVPGAGVPDHVAFRAPDADAIRSMRLSLQQHGPTEVHDRKYFVSLYVRDAAGILMEYATDGPGMTVDEAPDELGQTLFLPPHEAGRAEDLKAMLPQFALPGEERFPVRDLPFVHRFNRPEDPDGTTLVLLHGTGGSEADLMPIARRIAPRATLLGVRGRATEEGMNRWFRRLDATTFDQVDIRSEADAFSAFVDGAMAGYGLDPDRVVFLGYSNGANFLAAIIQLHPGLVRRAVLLRGLQALEDPPEADMSATDVLVLNGREDPFARNAPQLADPLSAHGARVNFRELSAGHELADVDVTETSRWIGEIYR
ncbi:MAG TPA: VOC family protein [Bosea sp. (in: a-proteobacteria)]|jgi:phospholipase/carboxylesterase|uniref:VOC family protein n=1 Tax=Bosea sp. (in: a-proteobacteria) TaxID=1871050 RepID=UPI002DDCC5E3|nr:VOC family protein [Bosea sp. (in: a-proteobacteria)]HEV2553362.1 VOC family protein [Bosea sp. (in: a-proteobacteria)]